MLSNGIELFKLLENTKYDELVNEWLMEKKQMNEDIKTSKIHTWNPSGLYTIRENPGKTITDSNPYINMVDTDYFDMIIENEPFPVAPPPMMKSKPAKGISRSGKMFMLMHKEVTGDAFKYIKDQQKSMKRISEESTGKKRTKVSKMKETDLSKLKGDIKAYAKTLGFASVGVTKIDMRYVSSGVEEEIVFDTIILLGYEMPLDVIEKYPDPQGELGAFGAYTGCANNVHKVADFIRDKGYDCRARGWGGEIKYPPLAVNAGLGNYSTYGVCVTPEAGTRLKYCAVLIDAELPLDQPKDFNIEEFCSRCRMCQKSCPSGSIPKEEVFHKGAMKRVSRYTTCLEMMTTDKECLKCVRVCPFSMIGYEGCMDSLPEYYGYNTASNEEEWRSRHDY